MKIKVCFEGEIHKLSNAPETLAQLRELIGSIFQAEVPQSYVLKYVDSDGDNIVMTDEKDYEEFRISEQDPAKITKVFVVPVQGKKEDEVVVVENDQKEEEDEEDEDEYQLIQKEDKDDKEDMLPKDVKIHENNDEIFIERPDCVKLERLEKLVSAMMDKSMTKYAQQNIEEQKSSVTNEEKVIHNGVKCNGCEMMPIVGIRYKCQTCLGFNYCEKCEKTSQHTHHNFVKMIQEDIWDALFPPLSVAAKKKAPKKKWLVSKNVENLYSGQVKEKNNAEEKKPDPNEAAYYDNLMEKVRKMLKCFPKAKADMLCAYVNEAPEDMTLEELVANYKI